MIQAEGDYREAIMQLKTVIARVTSENEQLRSAGRLLKDETTEVQVLLRRITGLEELNHSLIVAHGELQSAVEVRDATIDMYQKWFTAHEFLIKKASFPSVDK